MLWLAKGKWNTPGKTQQGACAFSKAYAKRCPHPKMHLIFNYCQLLKDRPSVLWPLQDPLLPGSCQSLSATSSILLTLCRSPERAISQRLGDRDATSKSWWDFWMLGTLCAVELRMVFMSHWLEMTNIKKEKLVWIVQGYWELQVDKLCIYVILWRLIRLAALFVHHSNTKSKFIYSATEL